MRCFVLSVFFLLTGIVEAETNGRGFDYSLSAGEIEPASAFFEDRNYHIWGGSPVKGLDGKYHLYYSRWERKWGFGGWVSRSEIAHAEADQAGGPYRFKNVALPARGEEFWDGHCTHNPTIHIFGNRYYLYYMGNRGDRESKNGARSAWWKHRNNQRIGVAVADSPDGPWARFDKPLIDISIEKDAPDALMASNPSITQMPCGKYLMIYKAVGKRHPLPFGGPVVHLAAIGEGPTGPFKKILKPIFTFKNKKFPAEDPYIWCEDGHFYAILKEMGGAFTKTAGSSLILFHSLDGENWALVKKPLITKPVLKNKGGAPLRLSRLERPQLLFEGGKPVMLFCAAQSPHRHDLPQFSFNVHIPVKIGGER